MPELAEVEYFRKQWPVGTREPVRKVLLHPQARVFRPLSDPGALQALVGCALKQSFAHGKSMRFFFSRPGPPGRRMGDGDTGGVHLGIHLGMSGQLLVAAAECVPDQHDHLVLVTGNRALVFRDPRMFGAVRLHAGPELPPWWRDLPHQPQDAAFDRAHLQSLALQHSRAPLKAFLLDQTAFPGIGNWMADEILWRSRLHPARRVQSLSPRELGKLLRELKSVCNDALRVIGTNWGDPPEDWLFQHRWRDGGICPISGKPLERIQIAGRTTCFSPALQKLTNA